MYPPVLDNGNHLLDTAGQVRHTPSQVPQAEARRCTAAGHRDCGHVQSDRPRAGPGLHGQALFSLPTGLPEEREDP